jgi:hypothetical protein
MPDAEDHSCWTCSFQKIGGVTFLGKCTYPAANNPTGEKNIPPEFVDKGCKRWALKERKAGE